jgi:hypothetical protein
MLFLTLAQKTIVLNMLTAQGLSGVEEYAASNALNAPTMVANTAAPTLPKSFAFADIISHLSVASQGNLLVSDSLYTRILTQIDAMDRAGLIPIFNQLATLSKITSAEATAINVVLTATIADPTWPATVPGPSVFSAGLPGFTATINGVTYEEFCLASIIIEARA